MTYDTHCELLRRVTACITCNNNTIDAIDTKAYTGSVAFATQVPATGWDLCDFGERGELHQRYRKGQEDQLSVAALLFNLARRHTSR